MFVINAIIIVVTSALLVPANKATVGVIALIALAAVGGTVFCYTAVYLFQFALAPYRQRNQARCYARALEAHVKALEEWARRREIAEEFLWDSLAHRGAIIQDGFPLTPEDLEADWRIKVEQTAVLMESHGASDSELNELRNGLNGLDDHDDGYGADQLRRLWNNMGVISQNLRSVNRSEPRPSKPVRPANQ